MHSPELLTPQPMLFDVGPWLPVNDGDPIAFGIIRRHYSFRRYRDGRRSDPSNPTRRLFMGPGEKLVLVTPERNAVFCWRVFLNDDGQEGINCSAFRNESPQLSSMLILAAEEHAFRKWGLRRLYTYVNPKKIRRFNERHREHRPAGYCFLQAGYKFVRETAKGLHILAKEPNDRPEDRG